jgi:hypothetical protein
MQRYIVLFGSSVVVFSSLLACSGSDKSSPNTTTAQPGAPLLSPDGGTSNKPKLGDGSSSGGTKTPTKDAGTTKPQPETQTCKGAALCGDACADDDFECQDKCTDNMSDAEREKMKQVWLCIGDSGCNDDACVQEACAAEIAACIGD